jgi:hypothetical protein
MSNQWVNWRGEAIHPDSSRGSGGCGAFLSRVPTGCNLDLSSWVPEPRSPAGRHFFLTHDQKRRLQSGISDRQTMKQYADGLSVLYAIASILGNADPPALVPEKYRTALQELSDAKEDRTEGRRHRFEHAMRVLQPALKVADSSHFLSRTRDILKIDALLHAWKMICTSGPASLPIPRFHEKFEYLYVAHEGETIAEVARHFGHKNAAPLAHPAYGYAPNMRLAEGDKVYIPFPPSRLQNFIDAAEISIEGAKEGLREAVERLHLDREDFEQFLLMIEAISVLVNMAAAMGTAINLGAKASRAVTERYAEKITEEVVMWGRDESVKTSAELLGLAIEGSGAPKKGILLILRHTPIGWLSPNYWTALGFALFNGQHELFLYGPEGLEEKRIETLAHETKRYLREIEGRIAVMKNQLASPIYKPKNGH